MQPHIIQHHDYDLLLGHKNPMALRLHDAQHSAIQVGDLVEFSGHNTVMDRQRFKVVGAMRHPSIHDAVNSIHHSNLNTRDKIKMTNSFMGVHGAQASNHPVVAMQLQPHPNTSAMNRSISSFG